MVEELLEVDLATLSDDELSSLMVGSRRERARLDAGIARLTSEWDRRRVWDGDDAKSGAAWISHSCKLPIAWLVSPPSANANGQVHCGFHNRRKGRRPRPPPS